MKLKFILAAFVLPALMAPAVHAQVMWARGGGNDAGCTVPVTSPWSSPSSRGSAACRMASLPSRAVVGSPLSNTQEATGRPGAVTL